MIGRAWSVLILVAATAAAATTPGRKIELRQVPQPDVAALGDVGARLAEEVARLEATLARPELEDRRAAEAYGELGQLYLAYELWDAAEACLANAAALAPRDPRWSYYLGYLYRRTGRLDQAAASFERTLELHPGYLPAVLRLGRVYLQLGLAERIEPLLESAGDAVEGESAARVLRGRAALALRRYEEARRELEAVLAAEPEAGWVHYQLALAYRGLGRLEEARRHLELQTPGSFPIADPLIGRLSTLASDAGQYWRRAMAAYEAGRMEQALDEFRRALDSDPERTDIRTALAVILAETGDLESAHDEYRRVLERDPEALLARLGLGRVLARSGRHAEALEEYVRVLAGQPDLGDALAARSESLEALGRAEEALADRARLAALEPWNVAARMAYARSLVRAERPRQAIGELESVLEVDPGNAAAVLDLGGIHARLGSPEAARWLRAVLELEAPAALRAAAQFNLGLLAVGEGEPEDAAEWFGAAAELRPQWVEAHVRLGEQLEQSGRVAAAAAAFGRAVELRPDDVAARLAQARCLIAAESHAEALGVLEEGLVRSPTSGSLAHAVARLLAASPEDSLRDGRRAVELASGVFRAEASLAHAETLAMALAEVGRFAEAAELQTEIIRRAEGSGASPWEMDRLRQRLADYQIGRPARLGGAPPSP